MRRTVVFAALGLAAIAAIAVGIAIGPTPTGWGSLVDLISGNGDPTSREILLQVRFPRVALAALVGAALAGAGAAYQAVLRNPLADPYVLGISGGAALGVVLATGLAAAGTVTSGLLRPAVAFAGAILTLVVLFLLTRLGARGEATTLLLAGVVLNAFDSAIILLVMSLSGPDRFQEALFFLMGYFPAAPPWSAVVIAAIAIPSGLVGLTALGHTLNVLSLGEEEAAALGVRVERATWGVIAIASALIATSVAFAGIVGFVGLIVPHAIRAVIGHDHRWLVPGSALAGSAFLVLADGAARTIAAPSEMPVGVLTALLGGPFFLALLFRRVRSGR